MAITVFHVVNIGGPSQPIRPRAPLTVPRTQPRPPRKEQKNDDQLFEFLNSAVPPTKDRKPNKAKPTDEISDARVRQQGSTTQGKARLDQPSEATEDRGTIN